MRNPLPCLTFASLLLVGVACTQNDAKRESSAVQVRSTDDACEVSTREATSGTVVFEVTNDGSQATEFYVFAEDGVRIVGEVENVGPGISRNLVVQVAAGSYFTECKPGMAGDGIRSAFTVTDSGAAVTSSGVAELLTTATDR